MRAERMKQGEGRLWDSALFGREKFGEGPGAVQGNAWQRPGIAFFGDGLHLEIPCNS